MEESNYSCIRYIWFRYGVFGICRSEPSGSSYDKGCGKCSVAGQSDTQNCRDIWRNDECHRTSESGHWSFFKERSSVPCKIWYKSDRKCMRKVKGRLYRCRRTAGRYRYWYAWDECILPECKRGRNCIWSEAGSSLWYNTGSKEGCKAAGDHEAQSECYRYYWDGKSCGSRRSRCAVTY